jgi:hypothetical protein
MASKRTLVPRAVDAKRSAQCNAMDSLTIKSSCSDCSLSFRERDGEYFKVVLTSHDHSASVRVWGYEDSHLLASLFQKMLQLTNDKSAELSWCSIEGEFELHATADKVGHIYLRAVLNNVNKGTFEPWKLEATIASEIGQIEKAAKEVSIFFKN